MDVSELGFVLCFWESATSCLACSMIAWQISEVSYWMRLEGKPSKLTNGVIGRRLEGQQGTVHINLCNSSCELLTNPERTCKYKPLLTEIYFECICAFFISLYLLCENRNDVQPKRDLCRITPWSSSSKPWQRPQHTSCTCPYSKPHPSRRTGGSIYLWHIYSELFGHYNWKLNK